MSSQGGPPRLPGRLTHAGADLVVPFVGVIIFIGLWWLGTIVLVPETSFISRFAPDLTVAALVHLVVSGQLWPHVFASLRRVAIGLAIATAIGFPLGLGVGRLQLFARASGPIFQFIRMVSPLSWTPLAIILLGVGDAPVYFLIAIGSIWPIVLNTASAVMALDPRWAIVARSLGADRWEIARTVAWPGIRPGVLTGLRLAVGLAWIILVPAEMLGVDSGLGYFILDARDRLAYSELMAAIIAIGLCGFLLDWLARLVLSARTSSPGTRPTQAPAALAEQRSPSQPESAVASTPALFGEPGETWRPASEDRST